MARYYIDLINGHGLVLDDVGQEFASRESASKEAVHVLPEIALDEARDVQGINISVKVRDETGRYFFEASLQLEARWLD
jgi:hypothetical protein